jgi:hypothetical protein
VGEQGEACLPAPAPHTICPTNPLQLLSSAHRDLLTHAMCYALLLAPQAHPARPGRSRLPHPCTRIPCLGRCSWHWGEIKAEGSTGRTTTHGAEPIPVWRGTCLELSLLKWVEQCRWLGNPPTPTKSCSCR